MSGIYGLKSTRDNVIRYVGQATNIRRRFNQHYKCSREYPKDRWIAQERHDGYDLTYCVLEWCAHDQLSDRESYWTQRIPNLFNRRLPKYIPALVSPSDKEHIKEAQGTSQFFENWLGHIGIRYYPKFDSWRAFVFCGSCFTHLRGDGGPVSMRNETYIGEFGRTQHWGDWHFSDPNDAIKARDYYRTKLDEGMRGYGQPIQWPQDRPISR